MIAARPHRTYVQTNSRNVAEVAGVQLILEYYWRHVVADSIEDVTSARTIGAVHDTASNELVTVTVRLPTRSPTLWMGCHVARV